MEVNSENVTLEEGPWRWEKHKRKRCRLHLNHYDNSCRSFWLLVGSSWWMAGSLGCSLVVDIIWSLVHCVDLFSHLRVVVCLCVLALLSSIPAIHFPVPCLIVFKRTVTCFVFALVCRLFAMTLISLNPPTRVPFANILLSFEPGLPLYSLFCFAWLIKVTCYHRMLFLFCSYTCTVYY